MSLKPVWNHPTSTMQAYRFRRPGEIIVLGPNNALSRNYVVASSSFFIISESNPYLIRLGKIRRLRLCQHAKNMTPLLPPNCFLLFWGKLACTFFPFNNFVMAMIDIALSPTPQLLCKTDKNMGNYNS